MGFFSSMFKLASVASKPKKKVLSFEEQELERKLQILHSDDLLIYKKYKGPSGKTYKVDVKFATPTQKVFVDTKNIIPPDECDIEDWKEDRKPKSIRALILMEYTTLSGNTDIRAVQIRSFDPEEKLFWGFCFLKESYLTFSNAGVKEAIDLKTTKEIPDVIEFLVQQHITNKK